MRRKKAFTLVELLLVILISSILILMIGSISGIAFSSHDQIRKGGDVYSDLFYGFNLLAYSLRNASAVSVNSVNNELTVNNTNPACNRTFRSNGADFTYIDSGGEHSIIQEVNGLNFDVRCVKGAGGDWLPGSCNLNSRIFHITLAGKKDNESFSLFSDVLRRN